MHPAIRRVPDGFVAALWLGLLMSAADAQVPAPSDIQRQTDEAFRSVLDDVASAQARIRYSSLLVEAGNYEGGIAALEGLLLVPDAPASIRVDLAVLYFRMGSYAMAEAYLRQALADPMLDAGLKTQAEVLLADVVRRNQKSVVSGSFLVGLRTQSNPTLAPRDNQVLSLGQRVPRDPAASPRSDSDAQVWLKLDHVLDLDMQNEATVVTNLVGFANHFSSVSSYAYQPGVNRPFDITALGGTTGIRFRPSPEVNRHLTLRPYVIYGNWLLNGATYFAVGGMGGDVNYHLSETRTVGALYEWRRYSYASRPDINDAASLSGNEQTLRVRGSTELGVNKVMHGELGFTDRTARKDALGFRGPEAKLAFVYTYADPITAGRPNWTATLAGSVLQRRYTGIDPAVDPVNRRQDTYRRLALNNAIPLARNQYLQLQLEYTSAVSNMPNYSFNNLAGSVNVLWNY